MSIKTVIAIVLAMATAIAGHAQSHGTYTVRGRVDNPRADGRTIYIKRADDGRAIDSTIVTGGRFFFTGRVDTAELCRVAVGYNAYGYFILEDGNIDVDLTNHYSPSGTPMNDKMRRITEFAASTEGAADRQERLAEAARKLFTRHNNDALGYYLLYGSDIFRLQCDSMRERIVNSLGPWLMSQRIVQDGIIARDKAKRETAMGCMFTDFEGTDADGNPRRLSDYVGHGRYVLMDFWAGWCATCREEAARLAQLHGRYAGRGLTVLGVYVWDKPERMARDIRRDGITWPQIADTNDTATRLYGVSCIPGMVLFDPDGRIVARDLQGDKLTETVEKLFD